MAKSGRRVTTARLRLHAFEPLSRANGPGVRATIWVQGCSLACPGCLNPQTHADGGGSLVAVEDLITRIAALGNAIEGLSVSGGEPLEQAPAVAALSDGVRRETGLSVLVFTGFRWDEIKRLPNAELLLASIDVLIAGRYDRRRPARPDQRYLRGSTNQTVHLLTGRYTLEELQDVPPGEVIITAGGDVMVSGTEAPDLT